MVRRRRRRRPKRGKSRRDARPERFVDVRVERSPKGRGSVKVTKTRRRNGEVIEESHEL